MGESAGTGVSARRGGAYRAGTVCRMASETPACNAGDDSGRPKHTATRSVLSRCGKSPGLLISHWNRLDSAGVRATICYERGARSVLRETVEENAEAAVQQGKAHRLNP